MTECRIGKPQHRPDEMGVELACGSVTTMGRFQLDGNRPPLLKCAECGEYHHARPMNWGPHLSECPACHGIRGANHYDSHADDL